MKTTKVESMSHSRTGRSLSMVSTALAAIAGLCLVTSATGAGAAETAPDGMSISGGWFRTLVPGRPAGGYFVLTNDGDDARVLVGVSSPACGMAMLHRTMEEGGVAKMRSIDEVEVPAHGEVTFEPGGYHVMCMNPGEQMKPGNKVPVTLEFSDGAALQSDFDVKSATGN